MIFVSRDFLCKELQKIDDEFPVMSIAGFGLYQEDRGL